MLPSKHIPTENENCTSDIDVLEGLRSTTAYPFNVSKIDFFETHISYVFLAGEFAYKVKKPLKTPFLDYSTLERRQHFCLEELRLDSRYSENLYLGVVPIVLKGGHVKVEEAGTPIEFAVKMHRFPPSALLSEQIDSGLIDQNHLRDLAETIARFHFTAIHCETEAASKVPLSIHDNLLEIIAILQSDERYASFEPTSLSYLKQLHKWAVAYFNVHRSDFNCRATEGFIRECHGDLHLQNVVLWKGKLVPFDGIEFSERFRWIDVASDIAFLAMDLAARGHIDLSRTFVNDYLEFTGDYSSLTVLRYYLVYRSLIRAMVSQMTAKQHSDNRELADKVTKVCREHIELAQKFTLDLPKKLYITHGVSGSGKSTRSRRFISQLGAIRVRSDAERKRLIGVHPVKETTKLDKALLYSSETSLATYERLEMLARQILNSGHSVIVDATFLKTSERRAFHQIAVDLKVPFQIIDCQADTATLQERIVARNFAGQDISDADLQVLEHQQRTQEPLDNEERQFVLSEESEA